MIHVARRIFSSIILFSLIFGLFIYLCFTNAGLQFLLSTASHFTGNQLKFVNPRGQLIGPINIDEVKFSSTQTTQFSAKNVEFDWQPLQLFFGKLYIIKLHADNIELALPSSVKAGATLKPATPKAADSPSPNKFLDNLINKQYLLRVHLGDISLDRISVFQPGTKQIIVIDSINCKLVDTGGNTSSLDFTVRAPTAKIDVHGFIGKDNNNLKWNIDIPKLQDLLPGATGYINSQGQLQGAQSKPKIEASFHLANFQYGYSSLSDIQAKVDLDFSSPKPQPINLEIKNLQYSRYALNQTKLIGKISLINNKNQSAVKATLLLDQTVVSMLISDESYQLTLAGADLDLTFDKNGFFAKGRVDLANQPSIFGTFALKKNKSLEGDVKWHSNNQADVPIGAARIKNLRASVDASLKISGTTAEPKLLCKGNLYDGGMEIPDLNLKIVNIKGSSEMTTKGIKYSGELSSGQGTVQVDGSTAFVAPDYTTKISIKGNNFRVANTKIYTIDANPDLNLTITPVRLVLKGTVTIPHADIRPQDFGSSETLPDEVVIINNKKQHNMPGGTFDIYVYIKLILGDAVNINIQGLSGRVVGQLAIADDPHKGTTGVGLLAIKDGMFSAYGQTLTIQKGTLSYTGGAIDNPAIDAEAVKYLKSSETSAGKSLTVGARVGGTARKPITTLFSNPSNLSDTDILSYLILGQPSSKITDTSQQSKQEQLSLLISAAGLLNVGGSSGVANITGNIRKTFGLDTLGLETEATYNASSTKSSTSTTAFVLGKYLTPSLYVSYGISYLSSSDIDNIFRVRYRLTKNIQVQSEASSVGTGVDFLYSFERN